MNVLIIGSGGREHTLAWKIKQSEQVDKIYIGPGNGGTETIGINLPLDILNFENIHQTILEHNIGLIIIGPEDPLALGVVNFLKVKNIEGLKIIGPSKEAAQLESSKDYAKKFLIENQIPTAKYKTFTKDEYHYTLKYIKEGNFPIVLKADGLAAGKGVAVCFDFEEAEQFLNQLWIENKLGSASDKLVVEEFLDGIEVSFFVLTDGKNYYLLPEAKDYKRIGNDNQGPNTGGMGTVSPVPFVNEEFKTKVIQQVIEPTLEGIQKRKLDYKGFIFFGLINVNGNPFVIEYNVRMGDPETEVVLQRIEEDLLPLLIHTADSSIINREVKTSTETAICVILASGGYPNTYEKGFNIQGLNSVTDSIVFHCGTKQSGNEIVTNGGRVLALTSKGHNILDAREKAYQEIKKIHFDYAYYRTDIGLDLI